MISVIQTDSGNFNVVGIEDDMFTITGNLTKAQLKELIKEAQAALKGARR